jgi:peptide chain release factor
VVKCQATRSQSQNRKIAREILAEKVDIVEKGNESRTAIKTALKRKRKASKTKKSRRKYRALEENEKMKQEDDQHKVTDINDLLRDGVREDGR